MASLTLQLAVDPSAPIEQVAQDLHEVASALRQNAETTFAGIRCRAVPFGDPAEMVAAFGAAMADTALPRFATSRGGEPQPVPVPLSVSDRQFAQALAEQGTLSWDEAIAWGATGEIPATLAALVAAIPDATTRARTTMFLSSAQSYERSHPTTLALQFAMGWTGEQLDDLWRFAATL